MRALKGSDSGAALVEFAVVAPMLALLLIGLIDFGRYTFDAMVASNAARAGALYGAQNLITAKDTTGMTNAALADAQNLPNLTISNASYYCQSPCSSTAPVYYVTVTASGTFTPIIQYPGLASSIKVNETSTQRVQNQ
ncbi:MAG TPA: TadE/TadG family type IV pilus assembly protein [Candidatus Binatia bacterium]|nr:TadE/TadG family type IV pilus assembly protein [Candidatus Binatia bacterium]